MKKWIWVVILVVIAVILLMALPSGRWTLKPDPSSPTPSSNSAEKNYEALGLQFQSPIELPKQTDVGANPDTAASFGIADSEGKLKFNLILAKISPEEKNDAKTIYAGTSAPATEKNSRTFFGKIIEGGKQTTKIPKPSTLESYLVTLPDGKILFVAAKYSDAMPADQANQIMERVAQTLKQK